MKHLTPTTCALFLAASSALAQWTAIPTGQTNYQIWNGNRHLFTIETRVLGPGWAKADMDDMPSTDGTRRIWQGKVGFGGPRADAKAKAAQLDFRYEAGPAGANGLKIDARTKAEADTAATGVAVVVSTTDLFNGGTGVSAQSDGSTIDFALPVGMSNQGTAMKEITLTAKSGERVKITASKPLAVKSDRGELRIWLWADKIAGGAEESASLTFEFPGPTKVETANRLVDTSGWIAFTPRQDFKPGSPIGAEGFLDAPAGKHGWVQLKDDTFVFEKKQEPFKFWGTNIAFARMAVAPELASEWAAKFAKYGVNIVRFHKWTGNNGWDGVMSRDDVLAFDEEASARFDNMHAELKKRGIYLGWSTIFALKLHDSMGKYLEHYDEIKAGMAKRGSGLFTNSLYPLQTFAPDVQQLFIDMTVKWLERKNTVTGQRYADDPAIAYVELHNEADIFFPGTGKLVQLYPAYTRIMNEKFCAWLSKKYADDSALKAAWGNDLKKNESLAEKNIFPFPNYNGAMPAPKRVVDSYTFLYEYQNDFYDRYIAAIRKTGYKGAIVGGCWQASDMYGHLFNIASDRRAGFIDRHNYFNGERPMVTQPGSALLSAGMQQVGDRPFGLTEWAGGHAWGLECQPVLGLIGLGLQGWDYSAQFASGSSIVLPDNNGEINGNFDELRATGQHPFIARFLYNDALKQGVNVGSRRISMQELYEGNVGFEERFSLLGGANLKNFAGSVPNEALGAGRVTIDFVEKPADVKVEMSALAKYWDQEKKLIRASNGQIVWDYSERGYFTADTPAAQAVIGFGGGRDHAMADTVVRYENPFANVYVAAQKPGGKLADADRIIILALARTANRGDVLEETSMDYLKKAQREAKASTPEQKRADYMANPRLLVEPVKATITLKRKGPAKVYALDQDGCLPDQPAEIPVTQAADGLRFTLDGSATKAVYYLVDFR